LALLLTDSLISSKVLNKVFGKSFPLEILMIQDYLVSPELLAETFNLKADAFDQYRFDSERIDFDHVKKTKEAILEEVYKSFKPTDSYYSFLDNEKTWIHSYALFRSLYESRGYEWTKWPSYNEAEASLTPKEKERIDFHKFTQFIVLSQLLNLKNYANKKGIKIVGDLPIFVSYFSMDVWKSPEQFVLNKTTHELEIETGAAPDAFSLTGQKWGTPIYDWAAQKKDNYQWWNDRLSFLKRYMDVVRIDHFRGFCATWVSKVSEPDASNGYWFQGPSSDLFHHLKDTPEIIAEDLGVITPDVEALLKELNLPGMRIFQFMLGGPDNPHKRMNYIDNCIAYSGTHDNETLMGWFNSLSETEKGYVENELNLKNPDHWQILEVLMTSRSNLVVMQVQDILGLGNEARFNYPGTVQPTNWSWKLTPALLESINWSKLKLITGLRPRVV
jgi:4-alpha-glucanotransferase